MKALAELLASRRALFLVLGLAVVSSIPALTSGYFLDDYMYLDRLDRGAPSLSTAANLYRLTASHGSTAETIAQGALPWWFNPASKVELCRPLSGILFAADHFLFPGQPLVAHLHSLAWYLLLVLGAGLLLRRLPGPAAGLALVLFVINGGHWQPLGWLANRHAVVAAAPTLLGIAAHLRWREEGWRLGLPLSLLGYTIGLTGGETALQALAYLFAWELFGPAPRGRVRALAPAVAMFAGYLALYRSFGFGARGHEQYLDPVSEPARFFAGAAVRLPTLLADLLAGFPADLWAPLPSLRPIFIGVGLGALALFAALVRLVWPMLSPQHRVELRWLSLGSLAALLPGVSGLPGSRLVVVPGIGGAALIATLLWHIGPATRGTGLLRRIAGRTAVVLLALIHGVFGPIILVFNLVNLHVIGRATERVARDAEIDRAGRDPGTLDVLVLYAPDLVTMLYPPLIARQDPTTRYHAWWTFSIAPHGHRLVRTDERSLTLELTDGALFESEWEKLFRSARAPLHPGDRVHLAGFEVAVLSDRAIAINSDRSLDDPSLRFLAWRDGALRRVSLPPIGGELTIPRGKGFLGP